MDNEELKLSTDEIEKIGDMILCSNTDNISFAVTNDLLQLSALVAFMILGTGWLMLHVSIAIGMLFLVFCLIFGLRQVFFLVESFFEICVLAAIQAKGKYKGVVTKRNGYLYVLSHTEENAIFFASSLYLQSIGASEDIK